MKLQISVIALALLSLAAAPAEKATFAIDASVPTGAWRPIQMFRRDSGGERRLEPDVAELGPFKFTPHSMEFSRSKNKDMVKVETKVLRDARAGEGRMEVRELGAGANKTVKLLFRFRADQLELCVSGNDEKEWPSEFDGKGTTTLLLAPFQPDRLVQTHPIRLREPKKMEPKRVAPAPAPAQ
jgi:hypothetical protein